MPKQIGSQTSFASGISFSTKEGLQNSYAFGRAIDHRSDPKKVVLNPRAEIDSGTIVKDLPMWGARACSRTFSYGNTGNIYQKEIDWELVHTAPDSTGNGMAYFTGDRALYYAQDTTLGRMLDACTEAKFYDDFMGSDSGEPLNTKSLNLELSSSQYAYVTDTSSLSITSDLTIEAYTKFESLPDATLNEEYVIVSKWTEQSDQRSYKMDVIGSVDFFGDGRDGALSITGNTTEDPIDANCTGTKGSTILTVSNEHASFSSIQPGDKVGIYQTRGTGAGQRQLVDVVSYSSGTLNLLEPLTFSPVHSATVSDANKAQVRVIKQHTTVVIGAGFSYYSKAWDGLKGGYLRWYANAGSTINGSVNGSGRGFRGGRFYDDSYEGADDKVTGESGESQAGYFLPFGHTFGDDTSLTQSPAGVVNGGGGAGGNGSREHDGGSGTGGGGGSYGSAGTNGGFTNTQYRTGLVAGGTGVVYGDNLLSSIHLGSGGGGGGKVKDNDVTGVKRGGYGGASLGIFSTTVSFGAGGYVVSEGTDGDVNTILEGQALLTSGGQGGGSGGSILYLLQTGNIGTSRTLARGGYGSIPLAGDAVGGNGGNGRIAVGYLTSVTGTSLPGYSKYQDNNLGAGDGYTLRLHISSTGANSDIYAWDITGKINTSTWRRYQIKWNDLLSTAEAFIGGNTLGTKKGSLTSIYNSTSSTAIGADFDGSGNPQNYYDGLIDDVRIWNDQRTTSELVNHNNKPMIGTEANLVAYYEFEDDLTDSQTNVTANNMTGVNTPTYSVDVPFSGLSSRRDQDQIYDGSGQLYTLPVSIDETATARQTFVPDKDPQTSVMVEIDTIGTGDWTVTVHDSLNRAVATQTVVNGDLNTGFYEFIFDDVWRPILGASYHFHLTSTVADGKVVTSTVSDLETARFRTHYQFLVSDKYHPITPHLDFMVIGNERYLAKFQAGDVYEPHKLVFPSEYRVRSLAYWREFVAIGCWKGDEITDFDDGRVFFWDGINKTYNHSIVVPEGGVNAMFGTQDVLFIVAGYTGEILVYSGGGAAQKFHKVPKVTRDKFVEIAPGGMAMWRTNIHLSMSLGTDSEEIQKGVYSIGTAQRNYPISLGFDYPTSLGEQTSSEVKTSMVFPSGQDLYVGWQNQNSYGIDKISVTNDPYEDGTVEMLISDLGEISDDDYPLILRADFEALKDGESVRVKYKADREDDWHTGEYEDTVGAKEVRYVISQRMKEIQASCDLKTTSSTSPTLLGITLEVEKEQSSGRRT